MTDSVDKAAETKPKRKRGNPNWIKGMGSANPGGLIKDYTHIRERFKQDAEKCRKALLRVVNSKTAKETDIIAASKALLEFGIGKAPVEINQNINHVNDLQTFLRGLGRMEQNVNVIEPITIDGTVVEQKDDESGTD